MNSIASGAFSLYANSYKWSAPYRPQSVSITGYIPPTSSEHMGSGPTLKATLYAPEYTQASNSDQIHKGVIPSS